MTLPIREALKSIELFASLPESVLDQILPFATVRPARAGETIFCQGEPSPYCFGVLSGEVVIQRVSKNRRYPPKVLSVMRPGHLFGESCFFEESPRAAMASATQDGNLVAIRGDQLREWIRREPFAGNALLVGMLNTSFARLRQTSQELSVIHGIGRLLGSGKPFAEQLASALDFLQGSLEGVDDLVFYQRSAYWEEFERVGEGPPLPLSNLLIQQANSAGSALSLDPASVRPALAEAALRWENHAAVSVVPLFDRDEAPHPLQGLLCLASRRSPRAFSPEKLLLLTSVASPLAESLSRHRRHQDALAQDRLRQSKKSFNL